MNRRHCVYSILYLCLDLRHGLYGLLLCLLCVTTVFAQERSRSSGRRGGFSLTARNAAQLPDSLLVPDSAHIGIRRINGYHLTEKLGDRIIAPMDTNRLNTANSTLMEGRGIAGAYTGNIGSPWQSRIFSERKEERDFIFADAFDGDIITPSNGYFYDVKVPYTHILYTRAGGSTKREEQLKGLLTSNFGKKINAGVDFNYIYSRGQYTSNNNKLLSYRLFGNYLSDRYEAHVHLRNFNFIQNENGGLTDDRYITSPDDFEDGRRGVDSKSYPTRFTNTWNRIRGKNVFLTHRYNLGFYREMTESEAKRKQEKDAQREALKKQEEEEKNSTGRPEEQEEAEAEDIHANEVFVPVASVIHTVEYEDFRRRFISKDMGIDTCYVNHYDTVGRVLNDVSSAWNLKNTVALSLREGFQDWAKFGLTAFVSFEKRNFKMPGDSAKGAIRNMQKYDEYATFLGAELSKRRGSLLTYQGRGELCVLGDDIGEFRLTGLVKTRFRLFKKEASIQADGYIKNLRPAFFQRHYSSRYFFWDKDLKNTQRIYVGGTVGWEQTRTRLSAGVESIQNHIFFNKQGLPEQFGSNLQVITARLRQDFRFKAFGWDNELVYQTSSNKQVLALPQLSLYSNMYVTVRLAKVLMVQMGADVHYFTEYYAPYYEPATQQFINQDNIKIGNYPLVNAYVNFHLKQARFFVTGYNISKLFASPNYFSMPHYPINPMVVKLGVAVKFNN